MNVLQYVLSLRPAIPLSREKPGSKDKACSLASNSEVRRWVTDGSVTINGERWTPEEEAPAYVWSLIFFPKSARNRTTVV